MTEKEIIDRVREYFVEQGHSKGVDSSGACMYAAPCAIGIFLTDKMADKMDGDYIGIEEAIEDYPEVARVFEGVDERFLEDLQFAHDTDLPWKELSDRLDEVEGKWID